MAINSLTEIKVTRGLLYGARVIATKQGILKNRNEELTRLLGRIKEHLGEDEVLMIVHNDQLDKLNKGPVQQTTTARVWTGDEWAKILAQPAHIEPDYIEPARVRPIQYTYTTGGGTYGATTQPNTTAVNYVNYIANDRA
jgi:hypothetical protein